MKTIVNFLLAFAAMLMFQSYSSDKKTDGQHVVKSAIVLDSTQCNQIEQAIPVNVNVQVPKGDITPDEMVKYLLDFLGALLTTFILNLLHKWFPNLFQSKKIKDYTDKYN